MKIYIQAKHLLALDVQEVKNGIVEDDLRFDS